MMLKLSSGRGGVILIKIGEELWGTSHKVERRHAETVVHDKTLVSMVLGVFKPCHRCHEWSVRRPRARTNERRRQRAKEDINLVNSWFIWRNVWSKRKLRTGPVWQVSVSTQGQVKPLGAAQGKGDQPGGGSGRRALSRAAQDEGREGMGGRGGQGVTGSRRQHALC